MKKIKILYVIDKLELAGAQRSLFLLLKGLDRSRFEPSVLCLLREGVLGDPIRSLGAPVHSLHIRRIYGLSGLWGLVKLVRFLRKERFDILHAYLFSENILGAVAARMAGVRMVVTGRRDTGMLREGKKRHLLAYRFTNRWVDRIVCNSHAVKRVVKEREKVPEMKMATIPNGAEAEDVLSFDERASRRKTLGVSEDTLVVAIVANLSWIKGHEVFFKAARIIKEKVSNAQFWVIGDGVLRQKLESQVSALGLAEEVRFFGRISDTKSLLMLSDVSVNASYSEGMSNTVLESMALGVPVVATAVDGNLETVVNGKTGLLVPPGRPDCLAEAILRLAGDSDLRRAMGEASHIRIRDILSLEKMVKAFQALYEEFFSPKVLFIFSKFPRYDESFILREIAQLKRAGLPLSIFSLKTGKEPIVHQEAADLLDKTFTLPFFSWGVVAAQFGMLFRYPRRYLSTLFHLLLKHFGDLEFLAKSLAIFPKSAALAKDLKKQGVFHMHAEWATHPATSAWIASRLSGIPFSFTGHAHDIYRKTTMLPEKMREAAFVVTCTEANKRHLLSLNPGMDPSKIRVNYHGVDLPRFRRNGRSSQEKVSLLSVGSLLLSKGFDFLIQACQVLKEESLPFECNIIGGGPLEKKLRRQISRLGLEDSVRLLGYMKQEDLIRYYQRADLFALPVRLDQHWGIPNVLVEAMAAGAPVVCTRLPSVTELVQDRINGILIPDRDVQALGKALASLGKDARFRQALAEEAVRTVAEKFDIEKNALNLVQWFKEKMPV